MQELKRLESITWAANGNGLIKLGSLPKGKRVRKIMLDVSLSGTKDAADALDGDLLPLAVTLVRVGEYVNIGGFDLWTLMQVIHGRVTGDPTDIPGSGTTWSGEFVLEIPFRDPRQPGSDDGSMPCELLTGKDIEVTFGAAGLWGVGNLVTTAGTVNCHAEIVEETNPPQVNQIGYIDAAGSVAVLRPAIYKDIALVQASTTTRNTLTTAEVTTVDVEADGKVAVNNATHQALVQAYNLDVVPDSAAEIAINAARFVCPVFTCPKRGNLTKQLAVEKEGKVTVVAGTLTTFRTIYWRTLLKDQTSVERIAAQIGVPPTASTYEPAVASKSAVRAQQKSARQGAPTKKARLIFAALPGKFRTTPTPGAK